MTDKEKELLQEYNLYKEAENEARRNAEDVKQRLAALAPHKVGEIIKWTETNRIKRVGLWNPKVEKLPDKERVAVLTRVDVWIYQNDVSYNYDFSPINKDGSISVNHCYPRSDYEWTGEIHEHLKNRKD